MYPLNFTMPFKLDKTTVRQYVFFKVGSNVVIPVQLEAEILNKFKKGMSTRYGFSQEVITEVLRLNITL